MAKKQTKKQEMNMALDDMKAIKIVVDKYNELEGLLNTKHTEWKEDHQIYMGTYDTFNYKGSSNVRHDAIFSTIEALVANLDNIYWRNNPPFNGKPTEGSDDEVMRNVHIPLMEHQLDRIDFRAQLEKLFRFGSKYGVFIAKKVYDPDSKYLKLVAEDPNTIFWDLAVNDAKQLDIVIKRKVVSYEYLQKRGYKNIELLFLPEYRWKPERTEKEKETDGANQYDASYNPLVSKHEILEADVSYPLNDKGDEFEERIITVINKKVLGRNEKNPFGEKRYYFSPFIEIEDSLLGMGVVKACKQHWIELNDTINQSNDSVTRNLNEMRYINEQAVSNKRKFENQMRNREYGFVYVDGIPSQTAFIDRPPVLVGELRNKVMELQGEIMGWSGTYLIQQGMPLNRTASASEAMSVKERGDFKILLMMRRLENKILNPFMRDLFKYNTGKFGGSMRLSGQDFVRILGDSAAPYADQFPKSLRGEYDFFFGGSTEAENRVTKAQQLLNFINIYAKIPPQAMSESMTYLLRKEYAYITGDKDADKIFPKEQPQELVSPENENIILENGGFVFPNLMDNHDDHLRAHWGLYQSGKAVSPMKVMTHIILTEKMSGAQTVSPQQVGGLGGRPQEAVEAGVPAQEQPRQVQPTEGNFLAPGVAEETQI